MYTYRSKKSGFTLIEILVAATIIAVLIAIGTVSYTSINKRARDTRRRSDIEQLRSALEQYRSDSGYYPNTGASWVTASTLDPTLVTGATVYIASIPTDPKSTTQSYRYQATNPSGTPTQYYGYCLTAYFETAEQTDTCPPDSSAQPIGYTTYMYGARNP